MAPSNTFAQNYLLILYLLSRDPSDFWTSGQWMTERPGGSDVGELLDIL